MHQSREIIVTYMMKTLGMGNLSPQVRHRLRVLDPLIDLVVDGRRPLARVLDVDEEAVSESLNSMLEIPGNLAAVKAVKLSGISSLPRDKESYCMLSMHAAYLEFGVVLDRMGEHEAERLLAVMKVAFWPGFNRLLDGPLLPIRRHFDEPMVDGVRAVYYVLPAAFIGHLIAGDEAGIVRVTPHLRHLAQVVSVGATVDTPFEWIVLCA